MRQFLYIGKNISFHCKCQIGVHLPFECCFKILHFLKVFVSLRKLMFLCWLSDNRNFFDVQKNVENIFWIGNVAKCSSCNWKEVLVGAHIRVWRLCWYAVFPSPVLDWCNKSNCYHKEINVLLIYSTPNLKWKGSVTH